MGRTGGVVHCTMNILGRPESKAIRAMVELAVSAGSSGQANEKIIELPALRTTTIPSQTALENDVVTFKLIGNSW